MNPRTLLTDPARRLRHQRLCAQLRPLLSQWADGADVVDEYLGDPSVDCGLESLGADDALGLLDWIETTRLLTPVQRDQVTWQRARLAVERRIRELREEHQRFQQLPVGALDPTARLQLNPVRVWARMETGSLIDEQVEPPAHVVMFPVQGEVRHLTLGLEDQAVVNELADFCPCTVAEWIAVSRIGGPETLLAALQPLIVAGLICVSHAS